VPFPAQRNGVGRANDYKSGYQDYHHLIFAGPLVAANSTQVTLTLTAPGIGGAGVDTLTLTTAPVVFATDNDTTLGLIAAAINLAIGNAVNTAQTNNPTLVNNGFASVLKIASGDNAASRIIYMFAPSGVQVSVVVAVTSGTTQTTALDDDEVWLFEAYYENPTSKGDLTGISIQNVDAGIYQQLSLTVSQAPVANQAFSASVKVGTNIVNVGPIATLPASGSGPTLVTSLVNTMNAIGAALVAAAGGGSFVLAANNMEIIFTSPVAGANYVSFNGAPQFFNITGNVSLPVATPGNVLTGVASSNTFELWFYHSPNIQSPTEKYVVSFKSQLDGNGVNQLIEQVVNTAAGASKAVRINHNNNGMNRLYGTAALAAAPITYFQGGYDGLVPTNSQINTQGWAKFADRSSVAVRILINGGYTSTLVQQYMASLAQARYDCIAILDMPSDYQTSVAAVQYRRQILNVESSYAAIYTPDFYVTDEYTNLQLFVPPSGYVAAVFAYNDAVAAEWFAPAGLNRGLVKNVQGLRVSYSTTDTDMLEPNQINPIVLSHGAYVVSGASTLQSNNTALSNVSVRRMLITVEVSSVDALDYTVYEPNDPYTQFLVVQLGNNVLLPIKKGRGIIDFLVVSNADNNPTYLQDLGQLNIDYIIKATLPVKYIRLRSILSNQGAVFSEIVGLLNATASGTSR